MSKQSIEIYKKRNSSIELLKIISMFLIIISHWVQTFYYDNSYVDYDDYILPLGSPTDDISMLILSSMKYFGVIGNSIFLISSIWFLIDKDSINIRRMAILEINILLMSICVLFSFGILSNKSIATDLIVRSFFPTLLSNNWFITCYFLLYFVHPFLNCVINNTPRQNFKYLCISLFLLYGVFQMLIDEIFFSSKLIVWMSIYLCVGYVKKYKIEETIGKYGKIGIVLFSLLCIVILIEIVNYLGIVYPSISLSLFKWDKDYNVFVILFGFFVFTIVKKHSFNFTIINRISAVLFLVYVLHENILIRYYLRPSILQYLYQTGNYNNHIVMVIILSIITFVLSVIVCMVFKSITAYFTNKF